MNEIQTGDIVQLKSGGPDMVVGRITFSPTGNRENAVCTWTNDGNSCAETFPLAALQPVAQIGVAAGDVTIEELAKIGYQAYWQGYEHVPAWETIPKGMQDMWIKAAGAMEARLCGAVLWAARKYLKENGG